MVDYGNKLGRFMPLSGTSPVVRLKPGEVFFDPAPHRLSTLLGSCVAVCLWDERKRMGGMTHSVIPSNLRATTDGTLLHATDASIHELIQRMLKAGCDTRFMCAKLFGGFAPIKALGKGNIGAANIQSAVQVLKGYGITIVAQEILGAGGMMIYQDTETGEVTGRRIAPLSTG
jgi:chemotaxis protein CheD